MGSAQEKTDSTDLGGKAFPDAEEILSAKISRHSKKFSNSLSPGVKRCDCSYRKCILFLAIFSCFLIMYHKIAKKYRN